MPSQHRTDREPDPSNLDDQEPVAITTNVRRLRVLRAVMLRDLHELVEGFEKEIHEMSENGDPFGDFKALDVRCHASWIVEAIGVLDDLGWAREVEWTGYRP